MKRLNYLKKCQWLQNRFGLSVYSTLIILIASSCLERIDIIPEEAAPLLVVQGFVDNLGRVEVQLRATQDFSSFTNEGILNGAQVELVENDNLMVPLADFGDNRFLNTSNEFSFQVGNTYKIRVLLANGEIYESDEETILPPIDILDANVRLTENRFLDKNKVPQISYSHNITVQLANEEEDQFFITGNSGFEQVEISYPVECGFSAPSTPRVCWAFRESIVSGDINLGTNVNLAKTNYDFLAQEVPFRFKREYVANIRIQRMDVEQFNFWQDVRDQLNRPGSLFDPEFAPIVGNMTHVNGDKVVLGYFAAYGVSERFVCFDRFDVPLVADLPSDNSCSITCTEWFAPATFLDVGSILCRE